MFFQEPPRTQYDWNFSIAGIPVRVHPLFWLVIAMLGMGGGSPRELIMWVGVCFVSILVHELGHAFTIRYFGWSPHVVLYGFGGLAIYNPTLSAFQRGRRAGNLGTIRMLISLAGPGAGFLLAALLLGGLAAAGFDARFDLFGREIVVRRGAALPNFQVTILVHQVLWVNIYWGLMNLLPVYPLDGGQVSRELFLAQSNDGVRQSLVLSFITAAIIAAFALVQWGRPYLALMFGYMAYLNYTQISGPFGGSFGGTGRYRPW